MRLGDRLPDEDTPRRGEPLRQHRVNSHRALHAEVAIFAVYDHTLVRAVQERSINGTLLPEEGPCLDLDQGSIRQTRDADGGAGGFCHAHTAGVSRVELRKIYYVRQETRCLLDVLQACPSPSRMVVMLRIACAVWATSFMRQWYGTSASATVTPKTFTVPS